MEHTVTNDNGGSAGRHAAAHATPNLTEQLSQALPTVNVEAVNQSTGNPVITFDHVTKIYAAQPNKPALDDVSLHIYPGEFVFLVGHSGSGKSTFIKLLTRELTATSGHIYVADEDLSSMRNWRVPYLRRNIGAFSRTSSCCRIRRSLRTFRSRSK